MSSSTTSNACLGHALGAIRDERPRSDLLNIVVACLDRPDTGGLDALTAVVSLLHGDTQAGRTLRAVQREPMQVRTSLPPRRRTNRATHGTPPAVPEKSPAAPTVAPCPREGP
jgi:hypothetical protein